MESFGSGLNALDLHIAANVLGGSEEQTDLVAIAHRSLADAIDVIWSAALPGVDTDERAFELAETFRLASDYAIANPKPSWLNQANNDNLVDLLIYYVKQYNDSSTPTKETEWESFGDSGQLLERLKEGVSRIISLAPDSGGAAVVALARTKAHLAASQFIGDVLEYLAKRGVDTDPGPIVEDVLAGFRAARKLVRPEDPKFVILGHSLGGVISYDILTYFDASLEVDLFVTIGSQVALFEEMSLYKISRNELPENPPAEKLGTPVNIKRWLNVLDISDLFGFRAGAVFEGVQDYKYDTGYGLMKAHSGYFSRPSFFRRLGERLAESDS